MYPGAVGTTHYALACPALTRSIRRTPDVLQCQAGQGRVQPTTAGLEGLAVGFPGPTGLGRGPGARRWLAKEHR